jgi:hypothetical protein
MFYSDSELCLKCTQKHIGLHVKRPLFLSDFKQNKNLPTDFHEYLLISSEVVTHRETDMVKLIGTFLQLLIVNALRK